MCRVFTSKEIKDDFTSILEHDEDMWASIERAQKRGIAFKEMPRIFKLARSAFLKLTRTSVAKTESYALSKWKPQKYFIMNEEFAKKNESIISEFRSKRAKSVVEDRRNQYHVHAVLQNLSFSIVYSELLSKLFFEEKEILGTRFFSQLNEALQKIQNPPLVDLYWVRDTLHSTRKIAEDGSIQQLFQGRNPNISSDSYYEGDRSLANKAPDHMQLQIHYVKPTNIPSIDFFSPALALYVPENCADELSTLVVRSDG